MENQNLKPHFFTLLIKDLKFQYFFNLILYIYRLNKLILRIKIRLTALHISTKFKMKRLKNRVPQGFKPVSTTQNGTVNNQTY